VLRQRIISSVILAPVAILATWWGSWAFALLVAVGAVIAAWEWTRLVSWSPGWVAAGVVYIGVPVLSILWLRGQDRETAFWLLLVVWATDIVAYAAGRIIGGWKLMPRVSPKKTWAGLIGGTIGAAIVGGATAAVLHLAIEPWMLAGASAILALIAQAGDLLESAVKRHFDAKDSSALIPGHGGILDRIDGLLAAAPAAAVFCLALGGGITAWR
jgi:phosphatidate cytidylyltransferase